MTDTLRGAVLLGSVVLWLPFLRPLLDADLTLAEGLLRYAGCLLLSWAAVAGLASLVRGYAAQTPGEPAPSAAGSSTSSAAGPSAGPVVAPDGPRRRAGDLTP